MNQKTKQILRLGILSVISIVTMVLIPMLTGFGAGGFESEAVLRKFWTYVGPGIAFLLGIIAVYIVNRLWLDDEVYGNSVLMYSPDEPPSVLSLLGKKGDIGIFQMFLISLIIFNILSIFASLTHTFYLGIPQQQFTKFADVSAGTEPASTAENLGAIFVMSIVLLLLKRFAKKTGMSKAIFILLAIILLTVSCMTYGFINHMMRYQSSDEKMIKVLGFWAVGGFITAISGNAIPFYVMHALNNFYYKIGEIYSSDIVIILSVITTIILIFVFILSLAFKTRNLTETGNIENI